MSGILFRWNISYNARAGCEVLDLYMVRSVQGKSESMRQVEELGQDTLASIIYAMYNGGPSESRKFLKRRQNGKL